MCENFLFYSPLTADSPAAEPSPVARPSKTGRRTASDHGVNSGRVTPNTPAPYLARPKELRRFKTVGVHVGSFGECEDEGMVDKILQLLESLKLIELDANAGSNTEAVDRSGTARGPEGTRQTLCIDSTDSASHFVFTPIFCLQ